MQPRPRPGAIQAKTGQLPIIQLEENTETGGYLRNWSLEQVTREVYNASAERRADPEEEAPRPSWPAALRIAELGRLC